MIFESALPPRYGGKTWARCLLVCRRIEAVHIQAVNKEIAHRVRKGENRDVNAWGKLFVNHEAMQARKLPKVESTSETDWWGGAVWRGTRHPATLAHVAMKAFTVHYDTLLPYVQW